ncbi:hypothetical protein Pan44_10070 [Caulifigura coniformis]|uniref:Uncharacterized protein n=1 Tax=Caulifigura coniformis TaxID=2527983 RepID=A0A517SA47_9PLAN|nr:S-4TM family putative pore-forming effector [Caulifigura coniformis]QDT52992.1 hypothetical protein Pan44_10070 [Caulifigura coniformis]
MTNAIPRRQNELVYLVRAHREADRQAKYTAIAQITLSFVSAILGPSLAWLVSRNYPAYGPSAKAWAGLIAIATIAVDVVFLEPRVKRFRELKARLQDQFDTAVYDLPWNGVKAGRPVDAGEITALADRHKAAFPDDKPFLDWYPASVGEVPMSYARLLCQKSSMRWDSSLRDLFCLIYSVLLALLVGIGFVFAMAAHYDMQALVLSVLMPVLPAALQIWRERQKNTEAGEDMDRASQKVEALLDGLLAGSLTDDEAKHQSRLLQDELFDRRRRAPSIPERLYQYKRDEDEKKMKVAALERVNQMKQKLGLPTGNTVSGS